MASETRRLKPPLMWDLFVYAQRHKVPYQKGFISVLQIIYIFPLLKYILEQKEAKEVRKYQVMLMNIEMSCLLKKQEKKHISGAKHPGTSAWLHNTLYQVWSGIGTGCPKRWWSHHPWRHLRDVELRDMAWWWTW